VCPSIGPKLRACERATSHLLWCRRRRDPGGEKREPAGAVKEGPEQSCVQGSMRYSGPDGSTSRIASLDKKLIRREY
jgi:hypothetical protein